MTDNEIIKALECRKEDMICAVVDEDNRTHFVTNENVLDLINRQKAEIERLNRMYLTVCESLDKAEKQISAAKAEAIKEFAERLKKHSCHYAETEYTFDFDGVTVDDIDNLVKEMVGDDNENV